MNQAITDMLVRKIKTNEIFPKTELPFELMDIKIQEYKNAVELELTKEE